MSEADDLPDIIRGDIAIGGEALPARAEKILDRRTYIGGSDAYRCANDRFALYEEKVGLADPADLSDVELVQWGNILEAAVAGEYQRRTGNRVRRYSRLIRSSNFPWMGAHVDRILEGQDGGLEVKTAGASKIEEWGEEGSADIPPKYYFQVQHYICVTGRPWFDVPVLFGGQRMPIYHVPRDVRFIADLVEIEREFWRLVEARTPPEPLTSDEANRRWPTSREGEVQAGVVEQKAVDELRGIKARMKNDKEEADVLELFIKEAIGDKGDTLMAGTVKLCTWRTAKGYHVEGFDVKPNRKLLLAKEK
jgi:putative phage-type endonuclease